MLVEISRILSPGGAPTADAARVDWLRQHDRSRLWSPTWDTHRVWLTGFEEENRVVKIAGQARDSDDVGELMRRLQLSLYFEDVRLERTQETSISGGRANSTLAVHSFIINARARY
jgi:Tfp pilus assembly protein PilN